MSRECHGVCVSRSVCLSHVCVSEMCVSDVCVSDMCVSQMCVCLRCVCLRVSVSQMSRGVTECACLGYTESVTLGCPNVMDLKLIE